MRWSLFWFGILTNSLQHQYHRAFADLVAQLDLEFFDHARVAGGNFHGGFVALHGDEALFGLDRVAGFDQQLDHGHFRKVANVGDFDVNECHGVSSYSACVFV